MGWNDVALDGQNKLFAGLADGSLFYFLHSYYISCRSDDDVVAVTSHGSEFACAVNSGNVFGVQFHPEKSHGAGVQLLKNVAEF